MLRRTSRGNFIMFRFLLLACLCTVTPGWLHAEGNPLVAPKSVRKLVADGKPNAFRALVRWKDHYWLAYRSGKDHNSPQPDIVVPRSADGKDWQEALKLAVLPDDPAPRVPPTTTRL